MLLTLLFQGRTFASLIQGYLDISGALNNVYLPLYETSRGRQVYEDTLAAVNNEFPQYVRELQGTADGAKVPFHKVHTVIYYFSMFSMRNQY